jgi:polar amino acid transport system permease protein
MLNTALNLVQSNSSVLWNGLFFTVRIILISLLFSILGGLFFGALRCSSLKFFRYSSRAFLEFYRALPMPLLLLATFFLVPQTFGLQLSGETVAITIFSIWGSVETGELIRGALESLPRIQYESGRSIGLSVPQLYRHVLFPQALPRILPSGMNLVTRMVKTSSNVILVGVVDLVKQIQQIVERTQEPFAGYFVLAVAFFVLCFPIAQLAKILERRYSSKAGDYE